MKSTASHKLELSHSLWNETDKLNEYKNFLLNKLPIIINANSIYVYGANEDLIFSGSLELFVDSVKLWKIKVDEIYWISSNDGHDIVTSDDNTLIDISIRERLVKDIIEHIDDRKELEHSNKINTLKQQYIELQIKYPSLETVSQLTNIWFYPFKTDSTKWKFDLVSWRVWNHYDAYWIDWEWQLDELINILENWLNNISRVKFKPFLVDNIPNNWKAVNKEWLAVIVSKYDKLLYIDW